MSSQKFNCFIRIYVDTDSSGNIIRNNEKTGHYELQINGLGGAKLSFDGHTFTNPVFSYNSDGVTIFDGSIVPHSSCKLYTYKFTATQDAVYDFIITKLRDTYLNTSTEQKRGSYNAYTYKVKTGPFKTYSVESHNCFTATAAWCSWLGYTGLSKIASNADSYLDYLAWRMYDANGKYWTYVGQY